MRLFGLYPARLGARLARQPGALLARLAVALAAQNPQGAEECLCKCLCAGLDSYRAARKARTGDQRRFAAFVAGLTEGLADPDQQALVIAALSPLQ